MPRRFGGGFTPRRFKGKIPNFDRSHVSKCDGGATNLYRGMTGLYPGCGGCEREAICADKASRFKFYATRSHIEAVRERYPIFLGPGVDIPHAFGASRSEPR